MGDAEIGKLTRVGDRALMTSWAGDGADSIPCCNEQGVVEAEDGEVGIRSVGREELPELRHVTTFSQAGEKNST